MIYLITAQGDSYGDDVVLGYCLTFEEAEKQAQRFARFTGALRLARRQYKVKKGHRAYFDGHGLAVAYTPLWPKWDSSYCPDCVVVTPVPGLGEEQSRDCARFCPMAEADGAEDLVRAILEEYKYEKVKETSGISARDVADMVGRFGNQMIADMSFPKVD